MIRVPLPTTALIAPAAIPAATIAIASSGSMRRARLLCGRGDRLGLIAGSSLADERRCRRASGPSIHRHEVGEGYRLPHEIDHVANLRGSPTPAATGCSR